jgi:hypothetical protein
MKSSDPIHARRFHAAYTALASFALLLLATVANAGVPIRLSVKFMNDTAGNFPTMGALTSAADLQAQVDESNRISRTNGSEFELNVIEILQLNEQNDFIMQNFIDHDGDPSTPFEAEGIVNVRDRIRNAAMADPNRFAWRDDAVNVYVIWNGSGIADFPPNNDIVVMGQGAKFTTTAHEIGHIVDLIHTHEPATGNYDLCDDTVDDSDEWNARDDVSMNTYGVAYADLDDPAKEKVVDDVWFNVMSYHPTRDRLTPCQLDRSSDGAFRTRDQILNTNLQYVDANNTSSPFRGTWKDPYRYLSQVDTAVTGGSSYWVLLSGTYDFTGTIDTAVTEVVTRRGASTIREDIPRWSAEPDLERSSHPAIVEGIARVRAADRADDPEAAIAELRTMAASVQGNERIVVELEIAQRLGHLGRAEEAIALYRAVHERADDPYLKAETETLVRSLERGATSGETKGPDSAQEETRNPGDTNDPAAPSDAPHANPTAVARQHTPNGSPDRFDREQPARRNAATELEHRDAAVRSSDSTSIENAHATGTASPLAELASSPAPDADDANVWREPALLAAIAVVLVSAALIRRSRRSRR